MNIAERIHPPTLVLASTSRYRAALLTRLGLTFEQVAPGVDEAELPDEAPHERAMRLAHSKAAAVADPLDTGWVIGCDQVATRGARLLHQPGNTRAALEQLQACVGAEVLFHTAICVIDAATGVSHAACERTTVRFRNDLDVAALTRYIEHDQPLDCAGSFRAEAYGITLFQAIEGRDPTALIGLPLIALTEILGSFGVKLP